MISVSALPPSFEVITAAAVAVGQMMQTMAPCAKTGESGAKTK